MHFSLLAVIASLTAFMFVSATPAVFSRACTETGGYCKESSQCCSGICFITSSILNGDGRSNLRVVTHPSRFVTGSRQQWVLPRSESAKFSLGVVTSDDLLGWSL
ncbi:hypothetical protein F4604DRAFT_1761199 [Suillus subluteus]|nr:hypothetical protein F4604DRAFT_1761199 [Suillus subluteus]